MALVGLEKCLAVVKKAFCGVVSIRDTFEATRSKLETQLEESRLVVSMVKKTQAKAVVIREVVKGEFSQLDILMVDEHITWAIKRLIDQILLQWRSIPLGP